jgi:hypothetical protein
MDKAHQVENIRLSGATLTLTVDGRQYRIDIASQSARLARATQQQRENFEVSPSGYGIHWPDVDEDLSIDGLINVVHAPAAEPAPVDADRPRS